MSDGNPVKTYRVYFNRLNEAPQVWSVDEGDQATEINVTRIALVDCSAETHVNLAETDTENKPKAWFEVIGTLQIVDGVAVIRGLKE
jgi:hypothetical protein